MSNYDHFILFYGVPAARGVRVTYEGKPGKIVDARHGIIVMMDERPYKSSRNILHPRDADLVYLTTDDQRAKCEKRRQAFWKLAYPNKPYRAWGEKEQQTQ
jgi:hypothetical protein